MTAILLPRKLPFSTRNDWHDMFWRASAAVGGSPSHVEDVIDEVERFVWSHPEADVTGTSRRWLEED